MRRHVDFLVYAIKARPNTEIDRKALAPGEVLSITATNALFLPSIKLLP